jgi:hypothetical protein
MTSAAAQRSRKAPAPPALRAPVLAPLLCFVWLRCDPSQNGLVGKLHEHGENVLLYYVCVSAERTCPLVQLWQGCTAGASLQINSTRS